jgi:hypothetical protein
MPSHATTGNGAVDDVVERAQEASERMLDASRRATRSYLENTEKTFNSLADLHVKLADSSHVEWVSAVATAQAEWARDAVKVYVSTTRELLETK